MARPYYPHWFGKIISSLGSFPVSCYFLSPSLSLSLSGVQISSLGSTLTYSQFMSFPRIERVNFTPLKKYFGHVNARFFNYLLLLLLLYIGGRDSSVGIATRYMLDGPGIESRWEARFSKPVQTGPGFHLASYTMGTGLFPEVKQPERGVDQPPPYSAEVEGRVKLYICSPSGPSWLVLGWILPSPYYFYILCCNRLYEQI